MGTAAQDNGHASQPGSEALAEEKTLLEDNQSADTQAAME